GDHSDLHSFPTRRSSDLLHVLLGVPLEDPGAETLEAPGGLAETEIGAGDAVAEVQEDLGDAAHPDASDADEMDGGPSSAKHLSLDRKSTRLNSSHVKISY